MLSVNIKCMEVLYLHTFSNFLRRIDASPSLANLAISKSFCIVVLASTCCMS